MKKYLTILSLLITSIAFAQVDTFHVKVQGNGSSVDSNYINSKLVEKQNAFMIDVTDYGAIGDSSTDNTDAIQAAFDAVSNNDSSVVYFPAGVYLVSDTIVINKSCIVIGQGGIRVYNQLEVLRENSSTQIIQTTNSKSLFVVKAAGVQFDNIGIKNYNSNPTSGVGIYFDNGNDFRINNCTIENFYINIKVVNGVYWQLSHSIINDAVLYNMYIQDSVQTDGGDGLITGCYFNIGRYAGSKDIYHISGGGLKINSSKFQASVGSSFSPAGCIDISMGNSTSIMLINQCSFENFYGPAIKVGLRNGSSFSQISVMGCQFNQAYDFPDFHTIEIVADVIGRISDVNIIGNIIVSRNDSLAINYYKNVTYISVAGNTYRNANNPLITDSLVGCVRSTLNVTAGLKLSPYLAATPTDATIEYDGSHYYGTVGSTRYQLDRQVSATPSGNNNNIQLKNGTGFSTPASDSLTWIPGVGVSSSAFKGKGFDIVLLDGAGKTAFRSTNANSWVGNLATQYFQIGATNDNVAFTAQGGSAMNRVRFNSWAFQVNAGTTASVIAPLSIFEVLNFSSQRVFSVNSTRAFYSTNPTMGVEDSLTITNKKYVDSVFANVGANVASATAITPTGNTFHVTGTTNITSITATNVKTGSVITIIFDGALTFTDGNNLKIAGDFITTADDTITLRYDGTNFYEMSRSTN